MSNASDHRAGSLVGRTLRFIYGWFEEIVACGALVTVVLVVSWGVFTRYVLRESAPWTGEIAAIGFGWLIFMGASAGFKRGMHVSIDMLVNLLPRKVRRGFMVLVDLLVVVFCLYVCWLAYGYAANVVRSPTSVLRLSQAIPYSAPVVGFAFMALRTAENAWRRFRDPDWDPGAPPEPMPEIGGRSDSRSGPGAALGPALGPTLGKEN